MMTEAKRFSAVERRYDKINALWPMGRSELPPLTEQEALSAAKRLFRLGTGKAWTGPFKLTTGKRYTWIRRGVFYVNASGWHDLVHDISHLTHFRMHPGHSGHHVTHAEFEAKMIKAVVEHGWLEGGLRRESPKLDQREVKYQRVIKRITDWEAKRRRAENALKKLYQSKAYYEKRTRPKP